MSSVDYTKKPPHRRNDSDELDVFEAAKYFSGGYNDNDNNNKYTLLAGANLSQKTVNIKDDERRNYLREGRRVSLDVPSLKQYYIHQNSYPAIVEAQQHKKIKDKKKQHKQPSSPGGKIAQFINSLFNQTSTKKKNKSMKDEDESPIGRRKRRSSISHFSSSSSAVDARSMYTTSSFGFRTPPPYNLNTRTKSSKDYCTSFSDYKEVLANLSKYKIQGGSHKDEKVVKGSNNNNNNIDWIDEKLRMVEKTKSYSYKNYHQEKKENYKKFNHQEDELDDGGDSDSSSDLFELRIDCEFGYCSSGLPVYETTHMDNIKRASSTAITNGPIKG